VTLDQAFEEIKQRNQVILDVRAVSLHKTRMLVAQTEGAPWSAVDIDCKVNEARQLAGLAPVPIVVPFILKWTGLSYLYMKFNAYKGRRRYEAYKRRNAR
jgi:hypothetical protein